MLALALTLLSMALANEPAEPPAQPPTESPAESPTEAPAARAPDAREVPALPPALSGQPAGRYAGAHGVLLSPELKTHLDEGRVRALVLKELDEIQPCYGGALAERPDLRADVRVRVLVDDRGGRPVRVVALSETLDTQQPAVSNMLRCIEGVFDQVSWPAARPGERALTGLTLELRPDGDRVSRAEGAE